MKHLGWHTAFLLAIMIAFVSCQQHEKSYRIGLSQCSDDAWRQQMDDEMERALFLHPELQLSIRSADDNSELQSLQIDSFIAEQIDLLVVSPNEADGLTAAVSRAYDAGIPVIVADRRVHGDRYTAFIGGDNLLVGTLLADYVCTRLPQGGNILLLRGLKGSTPDVLRYQSLIEGLKDCNISIVAEIRADWFETQAYDKISDFLTQNPDCQLDIVVAMNDPMGIGAWQAFRDAGFSTDDMPLIVGVDALPGKTGGIGAIAKDILQASVSYPTAGDLIIQTAAHILHDEPYVRDTVLPTVLVNKQMAEPLILYSNELDKVVATISALNGQMDSYLGRIRLRGIVIILMIAIALLAIGFFIYYLHQYRQRKRLTEQLLDAQSQLETATTSKLTFFTNVSHDFRTPLTLIADPVTQLADDRTLTAEQHALARVAKKNAQVLLRLINQTLDFRKYESGMLRLTLSKVDMFEAMRQWVEAFQPLAHRRHVSLILVHKSAMPDNHKPIVAALDVEKTERIVYNLLANAFKFTPQNGTITVQIAQENDRVVFSICDTGCGIPQEHKKHIFETFYQVDTTNSQGSGIGLALVRSFVLLQKGTITLSDNVPTGSIFTISLPIGNPESVEFEVGNDSYVNITSAQIMTELDDLDLSADQVAVPSVKEHVLLVIDDNSDIRHYLRHLFGKDYTVLTAKNGTEGCHKAAQFVPDIIICDISMPDMDGLQVTERLKTEISTSHIPILMLTAHAHDELHIDSLKHGADAYMSKPFNADVIRAQVGSLVANRLRLKNNQINTKPVASEKSANHALLSAEEQFLAKFNTIVGQHLSEESLSVETIAAEMALSRTQLYRKIKQLTNYSPNELIRKTRLEHARSLLTQGNMSISEVAYQTGFSSPSYFTKCYSDYFGSLPSEHKL